MVFTGWSTGMNNRPEAFAGFVHRLTFADFDSVSHLKISKSALKMATVSVSDMFLKATD